MVDVLNTGTVAVQAKPGFGGAHNHWCRVGEYTFVNVAAPVSSLTVDAAGNTKT